MSLRTGESVENLSALAYAADISGTSIETMEKGLKGLTKTMDDANRGIGEGLEAFEELDISVVDTEGNLRTTVDVLKEAATKISAIENPTKQAAYAMDLFGAKAGPQLLPLLKAGGDGIEDLMEKANELGITMSTEAATSAAEFTDRMTDLKGSIAGAGRSIGEVLIPVLTPMIERVVEIVKNISNWAKENPKLVETITKVAGVIAVAAAVGGPILMAVSAFTKVAGAIKLIGTLTTGPIGLIILAVTGLALAWKTNFLGIRDITAKVIDFVKELFNKFIVVINAIKDKIVAIIKGIVEGVASAIEKVKNIATGGISVGPAAPAGFGIGGTSTPSYMTDEFYTPGIFKNHAAGINYIPKNEIALLHEGEGVLNKEENRAYRSGANASYSPTIHINNPVVRNDNDLTSMRRMLEQVLDEKKRQFFRSGQELAPGM